MKKRWTWLANGLSLLASTLLPALSRAKGRALRIECVSK